MATLVALAVLMAWFFPGAPALLQHAWSAYLPGVLDLCPLDDRDLLARSFLLLPLAPALSLYYEWVDPRTEPEPRRVLTPTDLVPPPVQTPAQDTQETDRSSTTEQATPLGTEPPMPTNPATDAPSPASPPPNQTTDVPSPALPPTVDQETNASPSAVTQEPAPSPAKKRPRRKTTSSSSSEPTPVPVQQMTIDSVLVSERDQAPTLTETEQKTQQQTERSHTTPSTGDIKPEDIDWNTVVE